ncbi:hypothetical protein MPSEU_000716600 [Mayamaea pseudoterrestris]|nr:hypothetical protein MPSEU_000716600 [Mayamaea pseudoterrestris]
MTLAAIRPRDLRFEDSDPDRIDLVLSVPNYGSLIAAGFHASLWQQLVALILVQSIMNVAVGLIVYKYIVLRRGSTASYILGYGIICPLLVCLPYLFIDILQLTNMALRMGSAAGVTLLFFRCIEAMHDCSPAFATKSQNMYLWYYSVVIQFAFDKELETTIPISSDYIFGQIFKYMRSFVFASVLYSLLLPKDYRYFDSTEKSGLLDVFRVGNICNNFLMAYLTSLGLEVGSLGVGLATSLLSGLRTLDLNNSPMTASASPSDFWGKRWNVVVSSALKRGVFIPVRKQGYSRPVAALACFAASGLLHEYLIHVMTFRNNQNPIYGLHLIFFTWNAVVLILEQFLRDTPIIRWMAKNLPMPLRTVLVLLTVLPVGHFFTDVYVDLGFFSDFSIGFPKFRFTSESRW